VNRSQHEIRRQSGLTLSFAAEINRQHWTVYFQGCGFWPLHSRTLALPALRIVTNGITRRRCGVTRSAEPTPSARPAPRRIPEILCFVDHLAVAELHNTHRVGQSPLVRDCVFRDPEIPVSENPLYVEAGWLCRMMTPQGLQIAPPKDSLA